MLLLNLMLIPLVATLNGDLYQVKAYNEGNFEVNFFFNEEGTMNLGFDVRLDGTQNYVIDDAYERNNFGIEKISFTPYIELYDYMDENVYRSYLDTQYIELSTNEIIFVNQYELDNDLVYFNWNINISYYGDVTLEFEFENSNIGFERYFIHEFEFSLLDYEPYLDYFYSYVDGDPFVITSGQFPPDYVSSDFPFYTLFEYDIHNSNVSDLSFYSLNLNYSTGFNNGYERGYEFGLDTGYNTGYSQGFNDGFNADSAIFTIFNGILNVALLPINFFLSVFNFEILGINLKGLVSALLTVAIIIIVIRILTGKKE